MTVLFSSRYTHLSRSGYIIVLRYLRFARSCCSGHRILQLHHVFGDVGCRTKAMCNLLIASQRRGLNLNLETLWAAFGCTFFSFVEVVLNYTGILFLFLVLGAFGMARSRDGSRHLFVSLRVLQDHGSAPLEPGEGLLVFMSYRFTARLHSADKNAGVFLPALTKSLPPLVA